MTASQNESLEVLGYCTHLDQVSSSARIHSGKNAATARSLGQLICRCLNNMVSLKTAVGLRTVKLLGQLVFGVTMRTAMAAKHSGEEWSVGTTAGT